MDELISNTNARRSNVFNSFWKQKATYFALVTPMQHEDIVKEEEGEQEDAVQAETPQQATRKRNIDKQFKHTYVICCETWWINF